MKKAIRIALLTVCSLASLAVSSQTLEEAENADKRGDLKEAYAIYKKLADQGSAPAQFNAGVFSQRGLGTPTDYPAAEAWFFKAAQQGHVKAQQHLASLYVYYKKDVVWGAFWYAKAAAQQDAESIATLSSLYKANPGLSEIINKYLEEEVEYKRQQELARQQAKELQARDEQTRRESQACLNKLYEDSRAKSLSGKVLLDTTKTASLDILGNTSKPNAKDKAALSYVFAEWERCTDIQEEPRKKMLRPEITQIINAYRLDIRSAFADLYGGKISYGELAKARARFDLEFQQKASTILSSIQEKELAETKRKQEAEAQRRYAEAKNQQQRDAELQRQQEARRQLELEEARLRVAQQQAQQQQQNNNFMQSMQWLQMLNQNQPIQPRPSLPVNCTSTRMGTTVTTNCF